MQDAKLHIIAFGEDFYAFTSYGLDAASAVVAHYQEMDSYCAPAEDLHEEFSVTVYRIPDELKEKVEADIDEANGEEIYAYIETLAKSTPTIEFAIVDVAYTADDIKATAR